MWTTIQSSLLLVDVVCIYVVKDDINDLAAEGWGGRGLGIECSKFKTRDNTNILTNLLQDYKNTFLTEIFFRRGEDGRGVNVDYFEIAGQLK